MMINYYVKANDSGYKLFKLKNFMSVGEESSHMETSLPCI
jgi:hypothetical protein